MKILSQLVYAVYECIGTRRNSGLVSCEEHDFCMDILAAIIKSWHLSK